MTAGTGTKPVVTRSAQAERLLRSRLPALLLGDVVTMDVLARNGFRFLGVPACVDASDLSTHLQRFRSAWRVDKALARRQAIRTISDAQVDSDAVLREVSRLGNPKHRFAAELFWPHLSEPDFAVVRQSSALGSSEVLQFFSRDGRHATVRVLHAHVQALSRSCQAMEAELNFLDKAAGATPAEWDKTLATWHSVWQSDEFWAYLHTRVEALDDPRLQAQDVDRARADLPGVLLGVHELLAERYAGEGDYDNCARHMNLIRRSRFTEECVRTATMNAVRCITGARLEDLHRRAKQTVAGLNDSSRSAFEGAIGPLLREAMDIHRLLSAKLDLPEDVLEQSAFDDFADQIQTASNKKIAYSGDERERNILYSSIVSKRLLSLPLSGGVRRKIEQSIRADSRILYSPYGMDPATYPDALACFFAEGEAADPDASLLMRLNLITKRDVQVDRARGTAGLSVSFQSVRLLVPRSTLAQKHGAGGQVAVDALEPDYSPAQRQASAALKTLERDQRGRLAALQTSCDTEISEQEHKTQAQISAAIARAAPALAEAQQALVKETAMEAAQLWAEQAGLDASRRALEREHETAVQTAKAIATARANRVRGVSGLLKLEAPSMVILLLTLWLWNLDGVALPAGAVLVVVLGRVVRNRVGFAAAQPVVRAERSRDQALAGLADASKRREKEIREAAEKRRQHWKGIINASAAETKRLTDLGRQRVDRVRKAHDERRKTAEREFEGRARPLKSQLTRTIRVKAESQKTEFQAYRAAKSKGFNDGKEPSRGDARMTAAEEAQARLMLRLGL